MAADRKAPGESSIHRSADGRWHGYVSMGLKESGKRDRRHVAAVKRADVVRRVCGLEEQRDAGVVLASGRGLTVEQRLAIWLDTIASRKVRPSTWPATGHASPASAGTSVTNASTSCSPSTWRRSTPGWRRTGSPPPLPCCITA